MADERTQKIFDKLGQMAMRELSSPQAAEAIGKSAKVLGPARAIANALGAVMGGITKAASDSGVQVPPDALQEAQMAIASVLAAMMAESGLAEDPEQVLAEVAQLMGGDDEGGEMPAEEGSEHGPGGEPMDEPRGALAAMGGA